MTFRPPEGKPTLDDPPHPNDVALFLHTSGTTSRPKGVPLTHANLAASLDNIAATYELTPRDRSLLVMPLFHVHGLMAGAVHTLLKWPH
jgi:long-subunit acyl-CoA synthetase (AMP-forming)